MTRMPITIEAMTTTTSITMNQSIRSMSGGSSTIPSGRHPHSGQTPSVKWGEKSQSSNSQWTRTPSPVPSTRSLTLLIEYSNRKQYRWAVLGVRLEYSQGRLPPQVQAGHRADHQRLPQEVQQEQLGGLVVAHEPPGRGRRGEAVRPAGRRRTPAGAERGRPGRPERRAVPDRVDVGGEGGAGRGHV